MFVQAEKLSLAPLIAKKPGGNGLGLWVSKTLIERYGGRLTAASPPGQGACFTVWLRCEPIE